MNKSVEEIIDFLTGDVSWHGETHSDNQSFKNLDIADSILDYIVGKMIYIKQCQASHPGNYSVEMLGKKVTSMAKELSSYLEECIVDNK